MFTYLKKLKRFIFDKIFYGISEAGFSHVAVFVYSVQHGTGLGPGKKNFRYIVRFESTLQDDIPWASCYEI